MVKVLSVKRQSDNEVFTVGDRIKGLGRSGEIVEIYKESENWYVRPKGDYAIIINKVQKL